MSLYPAEPARCRTPLQDPACEAVRADGATSSRGPSLVSSISFLLLPNDFFFHNDQLT
jgi:hypothetical protein